MSSVAHKGSTQHVVFLSREAIDHFSSYRNFENSPIEFVVRRETFGAANAGRRFSDDERRGVEAKMRAEGRL